MIQDILAPLFATLLLEVPIGLLWGLRRKNLALCVLINLFSNPLVNLIHLLYPAFWLLLPLELAVVAGEGWLYRNLGEGIRRPISLSVTANAVSFFLGGCLLLLLKFFL